jgi:uridine phosphorylase
MNNAELILNKDGSIYHLGLHREQLANTIITVGDPERVAKVSRHFDRVEHRVRRREFVTHTGWLGHNRISVISTGIGPDNIDIVLNELDALVNIDFENKRPVAIPTSLKIIRLGTTGGLQEALSVDSFVASTGAFGLDGLLQFYDAPELCNHAAVAALRAHCAGQWDFPLAPYFAPADRALMHLVPLDFHRGITATNSGFYGPQGRQLRAPVRFPGYLDLLQQFDYQGEKIVNLEMETAAILGLSHLLGHQAISLSVILANRSKGTFSKNPARSVGKLIGVALEKISEIR